MQNTPGTAKFYRGKKGLSRLSQLAVSSYHECSPLSGKNILIATTGEITAATAVWRYLGVTLIEAYISEITEQEKIQTSAINNSCRLMQKIGRNRSGHVFAKHLK